MYFIGEFASCQRPYRRKVARSRMEAAKTCLEERKKDVRTMVIGKLNTMPAEERMLYQTRDHEQ